MRVLEHEQVVITRAIAKRALQDVGLLEGYLPQPPDAKHGQLQLGGPVSGGENLDDPSEERGRVRTVDRPVVP